MSMMKRRLMALGVVTVLGAAGAGIVVLQQQRSQSEAQAETAKAKVLRLDDPKQVTRMRLQSTKADTTIERDGDGWKVVQPLVTPADTSVVDGILGSLAGLERIREVGETQPDGTLRPPDDSSLFGLDPARMTLTLTLAGGGSESLLVGKKSSFDGTLFVKLGAAPAVSQVAASIEYQLDKSLFDLREKRLAVFEPDAVQRLTISGEDARGGITVQRTDGGFRITAPVDVVADRDQVGGILAALSELRASSFVIESPDSSALAKHLLAPASVRAVLDFGDAREPMVILLGRVPQQDGEAKLFATREGQSPIIELSSEWALRKLLTGVDDLRDRHVLPFERDDVAGIELVHNDVSLRFEKRHDDEKNRGTWYMTQPEAKKAQDATLTGLLYKLWSLKAREIASESVDDKALAEYGLSSPEVRITLTADDGAELGVVKISGDQAGMRFATGSGTGRIDAIDASALDEVGLAADDYLETADSDG